MDRIKVVQYLIDKYKFTKYLEIGTQRGYSFFPIRCKKKIAVDPCFIINSRVKRSWFFKNFYNLRNKYFEMTSDEFFLSQGFFLKKQGKLDIVLIDGLHTFKASLKDAINSLKNLRENGVIIIHDCYPPHKAAAIIAENEVDANALSKQVDGWTGEWCGDTWKTITYLRRNYKSELNVFVLDVDYGLGIIKFNSKREIDLNFNLELYNQVNKLSYEELIKNPKELIGLTNKENYKDI